MALVTPVLCCGVLGCFVVYNVVFLCIGLCCKVVYCVVL